MRFRILRGVLYLKHVSVKEENTPGDPGNRIMKYRNLWALTKFIREWKAE